MQKKLNLENGEIIKKANPKQQIFKCRTCPKKFTSTYFRRVHELQHSAESAFKCDVCEKIFAFESHLRSHKYYHMTVKIFECDYCQNTYKHKRHLVYHMHCRHDPLRKFFDCVVCQKKFVMENSLVNHQVNQHQVKTHDKFECPFCDKRFTYRKVRTLHIRTTHFNLLRQQEKLSGTILHELFQGERKTFECYRCKYSTYSLKILEEHMNRCEVNTEFDKLVKCDLCNSRHSDLRALKVHMQNEHSIDWQKEDATRKPQFLLEKPVACILCDKRFKRQIDCMVHVRSEHFNYLRQQEKLTGTDLHELFQGIRTFECYRCSLVGTRNNVKNHIKSCQDKMFNRIKCSICADQFAGIKQLNNHMRKVHSTVLSKETIAKISVDPSYKPKCLFCDMTNTRSDFLIAHTRTAHFDLLRKQEKTMKIDLHPQFQGVRTYECYKCKYHGSVTEVRSHLKNCDLNKPNSFKKCKLCNYRYGQEVSIIRHMSAVHSIDIEKPTNGKKKNKKIVNMVFQCFDCKKTRSNLDGLREHMRNTHSKPWKCEYCPERYSQSAEKISHQKRLHLKLMENSKNHRFICYICKHSVPMWTAVAHLKKLHGVNSFGCDNCDEKFPSLITLKKHMPIHMPEVKHDCKICEITFTQLGSLRTHLQNMHGEKRNKCSFCDYRNRDKYYIYQHIRTEHFDLLRKRDRLTVNKFSLNLHVRNKHFSDPVEKISCKLCSKQFAHECNLKRHMQIHLFNRKKGN